MAWSSVPLRFSTASDVPSRRAARRPSAPRSSAPRTGRRGAGAGSPGGSGRRGRAPARAFSPSTDRSIRVFWPALRRSSSNSCASTRDVLGADAVPEDDRGQPAGAAQVGDLLAGELARLGGELGSGVAVDIGAGPRLGSSGTGATHQPGRRAGRPKAARQVTTPRARAVAAGSPSARCSIAADGATILIVEDEHAVARGHPVRPPAGGLPGRRRPSRARRAWSSRRPGARPRPARRPPAGHGRLRGPAPAARGGLEGAGPDADRPRRRGRQGHRPGARRRRLPDQAVRAARADEPDQGPAPAGLRRPRRRRRRPGDPPRRPA